MKRHRRSFALAAVGLWACAAGAADFNVNSVVDAHDLAIDGVCDATGGGVCTLRAAVEEAEDTEADDTIWLPAGNFNLTLGSLAPPDATYNDGRLTIVGQGRAATRLRGCNYGGNGGVECRLISLPVGGGWLLVRDLAIEGFSSLEDGGAVYSANSSLTVERCSWDSNWSAKSGGSIYAEAGTLAVSRSAFAAGHATLWGGEIAVISVSTFSCTECEFEGAEATYGGAVLLFAPGFQPRIERSLFVGNVAHASGGALHSTYGDLAISNSTFTGNRASDSGGAIFRSADELSIHSSTITDNRADDDLNGTGAGGGIYVEPGSTSAIYNSLVSGNLGSLTKPGAARGIESQQDCAGDLDSNGYNLIRNYSTGCEVGDDRCCSIFGGSSAGDPQLAPLVSNGGSTRTRAIGPTSAAHDAGNPAGCEIGSEGVLELDQRGAPRWFGSACDLGAFEYGSLIFSDDFELSEWKWSAAVP